LFFVSNFCDKLDLEKTIRWVDIMLEFIKKHKDELKRPSLYIVIGIIVLVMGYIAGDLENFVTMALGIGSIAFGVRDIISIALKDYEW
jgi:hypothetical protein